MQSQHHALLRFEKARQIAQAEVAKQKRHIFHTYMAHASYSYGKTDMWGNNSTSYNRMIYQFQGSEQSYWNVGVSLAVPVEDILDLAASVRRKRLEADQAVLAKDIAYDDLKLQISQLYVRITNNLVSLKTLGEAAAAYQGAGALNREDFENGNMNIEDSCITKLHESGQVSSYQALQTSITIDILTLEIISHTPIITNATTEITLDTNIHKSEKEIEKENKEVEKRIKKSAKKVRREKGLEKAEKRLRRPQPRQQKNKIT